MDGVIEDGQRYKVFSEKEIMPIIEEILNNGGECNLIVTGYSMTPTLRHKRDSVILVSPNKRKIRKGEIVLIKRTDGKYILHRMLKLKKNYFILNGDAQMWCEAVSYSQIKGIAKSIVKNNKEISCDNFIYRSYSSIWMMLKPFRGIIFKMRGKMKAAGVCLNKS